MTLDSFSLHGKRAVVSGASRGLGKAMAIGLAEAGADVAVIATSDQIDQMAAEIEKLGKKSLPIKVDLSNIKAIPGVVAKILKAFKRIDILVNNAGIIRRKAAVDYSQEDWDDVMNLNLKSLFYMCQEVGRGMIGNRYGKIINIASLLTFSGGITVPAYAASKGAVGQVTKALANEWAQYGVNVNAIAPGYMITDNTEQLRKNPTRYNEITARIPCGRWGDPEDLKGPVVFLASDASSYLHGHILTCDGGFMAR